MATIATPRGGRATAVTPGFPSSAMAITPADGDSFARAVNVYVGVTGDVSVRDGSGGAAVLFKNVPAGSVLPVQVIGVNSSGTTATDLVAIY
jgi:hypothetical protein